ncbi:paralemmin 1a [Polymixia lowei]
MEVSEGLSQQERLQVIAEKRKRQTEMENKKRQLEDDRRQLQHLKSKALRERWLLDGAPSGGWEQDEVKKQLEEDEAKTRGLEENISRMEQELTELETGGSKDHLQDQQHIPVSGAVVKVVHEMNGQTGVHQLSSSEVDELIFKADEASMISHTVSVSSGPQDPREEPSHEAPSTPQHPTVEITGLEAKPGSTSQPGTEAGITEASSENPVTMVFMGYQSVEDEAETQKVLGLEGTVTAQLVLIQDGEGKTSPGGSAEPVDPEEGAGAKEEQTAPPNGSTATSQPPSKALEPGGSNGEQGGEPEGGAAEISNKEKQPCKCCTIM